MVWNPSDDLYDILSMHMLGHPYDINSTLPERFEIDFLAEEVGRFELGSNPYSNLLKTFDQHNTGGFNIRLWIQDRVDADEYDEDMLID